MMGKFLGLAGLFCLLVAAACSSDGASTQAAPTSTPISVDLRLTGDPEKGQALFTEQREETNFACATCHYPDREDRLIGPGLLHIAERASSRVEGETAYDYLHNSIVNPSAFVVSGFPDGLMPQIYSQLYTPEQINDLIAYLYTLT